MAEGETVTSDIDVYRSAKLLIDKHGDEAPIHAAMKADDMLYEGDLGGERVWLRILAAVNELLDTGPGNRAAGH